MKIKRIGGPFRSKVFHERLWPGTGVGSGTGIGSGESNELTIGEIELDIKNANLLKSFHRCAEI